MYDIRIKITENKMILHKRTLRMLQKNRHNNSIRYDVQ